MAFLIGAAKVVATLFLVITLLVSMLKAHPGTHNPDYPPIAEYGAGFILFFAALLGFYELWLAP